MLIKLTLANNEFVECEIWCFRSSSELSSTNRKDLKKIFSLVNLIIIVKKYSSGFWGRIHKTLFSS